MHRLERAVAVPHDGRRGEAAPDHGERQEQVEQPQPSELQRVGSRRGWAYGWAGAGSGGGIDHARVGGIQGRAPG